MTAPTKDPKPASYWRRPIIEEVCPLCHGELPKVRPYIDLNSNTLIAKGRAWRLTPSHAELLWVLLDIWPRNATKTFLLERIHPLGTTSSQNLVAALMTGARKRIRGSGVVITGKYGVGYRVDWENQV